MHHKPQYRRKTIKGRHEKIYGGEYDIGGSTFGNSGLNNGDNIPCAVCQSTKGIQKLMIPGRVTCTRGWTRQYTGFLATQYGKGHVSSSQYICMDSRPTAADGGHRNDNGALPYPVQAACGALPCPKYRTGKTISCVVCTK
ncbi:hypothetical protein FSP39_024034 [Pinctada imbricata]|uniref:Short-chain collagen C4-like n=1 Tax=Pinctada imbricata TaxID=66713 RepID=A0AA88XUD7_PINIB|nr:hypothetical protein FSP39_024034 [Pinctada imbricata]